MKRIESFKTDLMIVIVSVVRQYQQEGSEITLRVLPMGILI